MANYLIDIGKEPRVIHNLNRIKSKSQRDLCEILQIKKNGNDRYFPLRLDVEQTVEKYVNESPVNGHIYVRCFFCNQRREG